jgi:hypothetical protein
MNSDQDDYDSIDKYWLYVDLIDEIRAESLADQSVQTFYEAVETAVSEAQNSNFSLLWRNLMCRTRFPAGVIPWQGAAFLLYTRSGGLRFMVPEYTS